MEILKLIWGWNWEPIGVLITLIVGIIGVLITLRGQGRQARCQQERQWAEDRRALREGLLVELQSLSATLHVYIKLCDEADTSRNQILCPKFEIPIYRASLSRIGRLTDSEIHTVFAAYDALVTQEHKTLATLSEPTTGEAYIIPGGNISRYREVIVDAVLPKIEKALEELRKNQD